MQHWLLEFEKAQGQSPLIRIEFECREPIRAIRFKGTDGKDYLLVANMGEEAEEVMADGRWSELAEGERVSGSLMMESNSAALLFSLEDLNSERMAEPGHG